MKTYKKFFGHLKTVFEHKHYVFQGMAACGLPIQGLLHDWSKFLPAELIPSVKYYTDGHHSPLTTERTMTGYSTGFFNHLHRSGKHHARHWVEEVLKRNPDGTSEVIFCAYKMPSKYLIELFCDKVAAGKVYEQRRGETWTNDSPLNHWINEDCYYIYHSETRRVLVWGYKYIAKHGWEAFCKLIRKSDKDIYKLYKNNKRLV